MLRCVMIELSLRVVEYDPVYNVGLRESQNMVKLNVCWTFFQEQLLETVDAFGV